MYIPAWIIWVVIGIAAWMVIRHLPEEIQEWCDLLAMNRYLNQLERRRRRAIADNMNNARRP